MSANNPRPTGRRRFLTQAASLAALAAAPSITRAAGARALRVGLTPVYLDDQVSFNRRWRLWLEKRLGQPVVFVQRDNYREIVDLLRSGKLDFAWLCGHPYVLYRHELPLAAVPLWRGQPYYRSYVIADAGNIGIRRLTDMRGTVFAYSDPDSNSGCLYPRYALTQANQNPATFFARTFFTFSHRKVVEAVNVGMAHGGAVAGYVWETLAELRPNLTRNTRVIEQSPLFGYPPLVARHGIARADLQRFRKALLGMNDNSEGAALLAELRLDGFTPGNPDLYDDIALMSQKLRRP